MKIAIAPATPSDLGDILALVRRNKLPEAGLAEHLDTTLVARAGKAIVGCAAIEPYDGAALLRSVAVDPAHRGRGLGQELTRQALQVARDRGARTVYLLTETAAGFFPKLGFRVIPRDAVAAPVQRSVEFTTACPASAIAMAADL